MSLLLAVLLLGQTVGSVVSIADGDTLTVRPMGRSGTDSALDVSQEPTSWIREVTF